MATFFFMKIFLIITLTFSLLLSFDIDVMLNKLIIKKSTLPPSLIDKNTIFISQGYDKSTKTLINQYIIKNLKLKNKQLELYKKILKLTMLKKLCFSQNSKLLLKFATISFKYYDLNVKNIFRFKITKDDCKR